VAAPSPATSDTGVTGVFYDLAWLNDEIVVAVRPMARSDDLSRQELVSIDLGTREVRPIEVDRPPECPSIDATVPRMAERSLVFDRRCYPGPSTPIAGYHELMSLPSIGAPAVPIAKFPWFPDSYAQVKGGAWLAGFDSSICAWIDLLPGTGTPQIPWPIMVTDDGAPYAVNAANVSTGCDQKPAASEITAAPDGSLAFLASAAGGGSGFGRLGAPRHLYLMDPSAAPRRIADGITHPSDLAWNADGTRLAVIATIDDRTGIWSYDRAGKRRFEYEGLVSGFAWAPAGDRIALLVPEGQSQDPNAPESLLILTLQP
jgi:hypothetical protein